MSKVTIIGIDLAKSHFQIHGQDAKGKRILKKTLAPQKAILLLSNLEPCIVAMEACGGAHHWARSIQALGHQVKIIPPQYVRGIVRGNHNDVNDAAAIAEAAAMPRIKSVPIKSQEQQDLQSIHRIRQRLIGNKTALGNQIRGILYEYGITMRKGDKPLREKLSELLDHDSSLIRPMLKEELELLREEMLTIIERLKRVDKKLEQISKASDDCKRLMTIPGVGPTIATAMLASINDYSEFKNGRHLAAWLGIVPGHHHTGGPNKKPIMKGITKRGDRYLRQLLIQGARAWLIVAKRYNTIQGEWGRKLHEKKGYNKAAVAVANKNARVIWALLKNKCDYQAVKAA
jgi:transposase